MAVVLWLAALTDLGPTRSASGSKPPLVVRSVTSDEYTMCVPRDSFIPLSFDDARLVRSNLGGQGGRCSQPARCDEAYVDTA
jgi:hypothetical protein